MVKEEQTGTREGAGDRVTWGGAGHKLSRVFHKSITYLWDSGRPPPKTDRDCS